MNDGYAFQPVYAQRFFQRELGFAETAVVFDVCLSNGEKPIRAEGKVVAHEANGLRVRFKRYGAATKAVDMNSPSYDFSGRPAVGETHVGALNWLSKVSANLVALQNDAAAWDTHRSPPAPNCT